PRSSLHHNPSYSHTAATAARISQAGGNSVNIATLPKDHARRVPHEPAAGTHARLRPHRVYDRPPATVVDVDQQAGLVLPNVAFAAPFSVDPHLRIQEDSTGRRGAGILIQCGRRAP